MTDTPESYRRRFIDSAEADFYDEAAYAPETYSSLLWLLEQGFLREVIGQLRSTSSELEYLDFACGTGRVLAFMEPLVDSATGVEISEAMLERAAGKVASAKLIQGDLTKESLLVAERFDLITAFRFVLNAEPELRVSALRQLAGLLRDDHSLLIFNIHINLWSYKLATWLLQRVRLQPKGNFMTFRQVRRLAGECGLVVERAYGCGFLSRRALKVIGREKLFAVENRLSMVKPLRRFGSDQIYVARRRSS